MTRRFDFLHPSRQRLRTWLLTGEPDGVRLHVEQCERCAARLEEIDDMESAAPSGETAPLRQALGSLLAPPDDLNDRVVRNVERRSGISSDLELFAGLFAIGVQTAQLMVGESGAGGDRSAEPLPRSTDEQLGHDNEADDERTDR